MRDPERAAEESFSFADYSAFFAHPAARGAAARHRALGRGRARPVLPSGPARLRPLRDPRLVRCGNVAVLIQPARGYNIDPKASYHDPALVPPHAYLRLLCLARRRLPRRRGDRSRQARQSRMAAGQGAGAVGGMLSRGGARAAAASLSLHRQRSRRGHAGQAPRAGGDHRSSDAAADPRRELWPAGRARAADRRILRGGARRSAPRRSCSPREILERARGARHRPRLRHRRGRRATPPRCRSSTGICAS